MLIDEDERLLRVLGGFKPLPQLAIPSFSSSFVPFHFPRRLDGEFVVAGAAQRRWFGGAARGGGVWREKGKAETRGELGDLIGFSLVNLTSPPSSLSTVLLEVCNFNSLILKPAVGMYILIQFSVS